jgi:peptidoglycan/LPS O-acetylase OafA/YrhL
MQSGAHRDNNFDAVRLIAALAVVVGHAWPLTGLSHPPRLGGVPIFTLAVFVFFSLSGYLVGTSWRHDPRVLPFLARRASRIFPALIVVIVLTTFLIGPIATRLALNDYFTSSQTWTYLTNVTLVASYDLPGVFDANPRPVVNGALWTLGPEFLCYLAVMILGLMAIALRVRRAPERAAIFVGIAVALAIASRAPFAALKNHHVWARLGVPKSRKVTDCRPSTPIHLIGTHLCSTGESFSKTLCKVSRSAEMIQMSADPGGSPL